MAAPVHAQSWAQYKSAGMWKEAWQCVEPLGPKDPRYFTTLRSFSAQNRQAGKREQAEELYKKALSALKNPKDASAVDISTIAPDDRQSCKECLLDYAQLLSETQKLTEAERVKQIAETIGNASAQSSSSNGIQKESEDISYVRQTNATTNSDYDKFMKEGTDYLKNKNFPKARETLQQALRKLEGGEPDSNRQLLVLGKLIEVDYATGNLPGADSNFQKVLSTLKRTNANSVDYARALQNHGALLRQMGRRDQAMKEEYQAGVILADLQQTSEAAKQAREKDEAQTGALFPGGRTRRNFGINGMRGF